MTRSRSLAWIAPACALVMGLAACGVSSPPNATTARSIDATQTSQTSPTGPATTDSATSSPTATSSAASSTVTHAAKASATSSAAIPYRDRPVIVIDPGHSPTIHAIDRATGLNVSDYENEPEMHDVYRVALLVRAQLIRAGYRVVMTKTSVDQRVDLAQRAYIANRVHAALAISIHDQAGSDGGIGFRQGNNTVYYQSVGTYRATPTGKKVYFTDRKLAAISKRFGAVFQRTRARAQHAHVNLQGNVGYNLGSRGLAPGNIWIVQLLSKVPWIYNEAGGNSAGRVGLDPADRAAYAAGLVAAIEKCVPLPAH